MRLRRAILALGLVVSAATTATAQDFLDRLDEALPPTVPVDPAIFEFLWHPAHADAEIQAIIHHDRGGRDLLGKRQRLAKRQLEHEGEKAKPLCVCGDRRKNAHRLEIGRIGLPAAFSICGEGVHRRFLDFRLKSALVQAKAAPA